MLRVGIVREGRLLLKKTSALGGWHMRTFQIKEDGNLVWFKVRTHTYALCVTPICNDHACVSRRGHVIVRE